MRVNHTLQSGRVMAYKLLINIGGMNIAWDACRGTGMIDRITTFSVLLIAATPGVLALMVLFGHL